MIGKNIKIAREQYSYEIGEKITQKELAKMVGVSQSYIGDIESGRTRPNPILLKKIAEALNTTVEKLLGDGVYQANEAPTISQVKQTSTEYLTNKEKRDIAKEVDELLEGIENETVLVFDGYEIEMDKETKELLKKSLMQTKELARIMAKKKFTPKKYQ